MSCFLSSGSRKTRACISSLTMCALIGAAPVEQLGLRKPPICGQQYAPPFADPAGPRTCSSATPRTYSRRYHGVGYDVLDLESEACFVPDSMYILLDQIVGDALGRVAATAVSGESAGDRALRVSRITGEVLESRGFGLYIPTETLGDALTNRAQANEEPRHTVDCDLSSLILLTVAENLGLPAQLVEITLPSGSGHNYVRWQLSQSQWLDWDTNGRAPCDTPENLPPFQGRGMSREETISYILSIRAALWKRRQMIDRAADDYQRAIRMAPERPFAMNNYAWMISTTEFPNRQAHRASSLAAAQQAVQLHRIPNYLDTLACALALDGNFAAAATTQEEALAAEPNNSGFRRRLEGFRAAAPRDCTGEN